MPINSPDSDVTGFRTLAQLRSALFASLGFVEVLTPTTRTLQQIREAMLYQLGYGAQIANPPPGVAATLNAFINEAQQSTHRRVELDRGGIAAPAFLVNDSDVSTLDYYPIQTLALALYCQSKGKPEAKGYLEQHEKYIKDVADRRPPGIVATLNQVLFDAQRDVLARAPWMRTERWFSWTLTTGERFYDLPSNYEQTNAPTSTKLLDPYRINEAWLERGTTRTPMTWGIPSSEVARTVSGIPTHFEVRQGIEIWPAPADGNSTLRIKGYFKATAFAADGDLPTVDDQAVYLLALAKAKASFKRPDANLATDEFEVYLRTRVAGTHGTARYVPGREPVAPYVEPKPSVPFA